MKLVMISLAVLWFNAVAAVATASELTAYHAQYNVLRDNAEYGGAIRRLEQTSDGVFALYTETEIAWLFLTDRRRYWSTFAWLDNLAVTQEFRFKRSGTGKNKEFAARYSSDQAVLDEAAMLEQLRFDLLDLSRSEFRYSMIDENGKLDQHVYQRGDSETLQLPYAEVLATKVLRVREHSARETYYWFAPALNNVMVKMQQREDGDEVATLVLRKLQLQP
jgi:hypothetical protein